MARSMTRTGAAGVLLGAALVATSACGPLSWAGSHGGSRPHRPAPPATSPSTTPPATTPPATTPPASSATDDYEARILVLVNQERTTRGLAPLTLSSCADGYAESWAPVLQRNRALSHQSLMPILTSCHARTAGENVAYGNVSADQMMTMWMNSAGHRANILSPNYTAIGIAAVTDASGRWYGVQDFTG